MASPMRSIGQVLNLLKDEFPDISISKIRFLESEGLLSPERAPSGYRKYAQVDIDRLAYILRVQRDHYRPLKVIKEHLEALDAGSLRGARIGVMRFLLDGYSAETRAAFEQSLTALRAAGAQLVEITEAPADYRRIGGWELTVLLTELKHDLNAYLASTDPAQVRTRTLADVIAFNAAEPRETRASVSRASDGGVCQCARVMEFTCT